MDVFALTSHNEANPVSILEAMACGVPVVAANVGSVSESVEHEVTGYLVPAGAADEAASRWLDLFRHEPLRRSMGTAARNRLVERWSLETMVAGYEELITEIYDRSTCRASAGFTRAANGLIGSKSESTHA
jgi:glycosyltransferase involved in cell wall biosynthesis